jgi:hypothetical protein
MAGAETDEFSPLSVVHDPSIDFHHDFEVMSGRRYIRTASWSIQGPDSSSNPREASGSGRSTMQARRRDSRYLSAI